MANSEQKLLFGMETEFGFAVVDDDGEQLDAQVALIKYLELCSKEFKHLAGRDRFRLYLQNGCLVYPDVGHPEVATAESPSPVALLQSLRASETMMAGVAQRLESQSGISRVNLFRTTVDYANLGTTYGCHESYLSRRSPQEFAPKVVDHLVSRIIYSGAGGFDNQNYGATFLLSPRVFYLNKRIGSDGNGQRAIFSLRDEPLSKGYQRVHLICGEPNCSELSTYLKVGTTALLIAMADAKVDFGERGRALTTPVDAISRFALNPDCRKVTWCNDGNKRSAIDIQRNYLRLAEDNLAAPFMPEWAEDVCIKWRSVLDRLEADPETLIGSLDWPTKLALFKQHTAAYSSLSWDSLPVWTSVATRVSRALSGKNRRMSRSSSQQVKTRLGGKGATAGLLTNLTTILDEHGLDWDELDIFNELRDELCELDLRYGQLYPQGIYLDLENAGQIRERLLQPAQIEAAVDRAPAEGRARVRGDWVRLLSGRKRSRYYCDWTVITGKSKHIDLTDPFVTSAKWQVSKQRGNSLQRRDERALETPDFLRTRRLRRLAE